MFITCNRYQSRLVNKFDSGSDVVPEWSWKIRESIWERANQRRCINSGVCNGGGIINLRAYGKQKLPGTRANTGRCHCQAHLEFIWTFCTVPRPSCPWGLVLVRALVDLLRRGGGKSTALCGVRSVGWKCIVTDLQLTHGRVLCCGHRLLLHIMESIPARVFRVTSAFWRNMALFVFIIIYIVKCRWHWYLSFLIAIFA